MAETVDTATGHGAEKKTGEEEVQRPKTARETAMEQIDQDRDAELEEELRQQQETPPAASSTDDEPVTVDDPSRYKVRVKVGDGEEERSLSDVVNELQTSNGRVRSLSTQLKDRDAALAEKDRLLQEQLTAQAQHADPEATDEQIEARVSEVRDALIEGDEEKVTEFLRDVLKKGRQEATPVNEEELVGKVKTELKTEQEQERAREEVAKVWESFVEEYPEFQAKEDPETGEPVVTEAREYGDYIFERNYAPKLAAGELSYPEALRKAAEDVRKVFPVQGVETDKGGLDKRRERKKEIDQLPVAAGARTASAQPESAEENHADTIAEMRKARSLPA